MDTTSAARFSAVVSLPPDKTVNLTEGSNNSVDLTIVFVPKRIKWMAVDALVRKGNNEPEKVHPFLHDENWLDIEMLKQLAVEQPYAAVHGKTGEAWTAFANHVSKCNHPVSGEPLYGVMSYKTCQKRYDVYMRFVKGYVNSVPLNSGKDDEEPAGEMLTLLQDLYDTVNGIEDLKADASLLTAAQKKSDAAKGDVLYNASLGKFLVKKYCIISRA